MNVRQAAGVTACLVAAFSGVCVWAGSPPKAPKMPPAPDTPPAKVPLPRKNVPRDLDPVVLTAKGLDRLLGQEPNKIVAFAWNDGWKQIPVQVDERLEMDLGKASRHGRCVTTVYADPDTNVGADPNAELDVDDEIAFMAKDAGVKTDAADPAGTVKGTRTAVRIVDALGSPDRHVYLFVSDGSLKGDAGRDYVKYTPKKRPRARGLKQEDSLVKTSRYLVGFSARWVLDRTAVIKDIDKPVDILDGDKFQFIPGVDARTTATFSRGRGEYLAHIDGPVRAIRSVLGANSGVLTQRDWIFYEGRQDAITYLRVHPIPGTWAYYDFSPAAAGMKYYDNLNTGGVTIDGKPDRVHRGKLEWQVVTGKQGTLAMALQVETDIPNPRWSSYYYDQARARWDQGIGDRHALGASGPSTGPLPNTDPGTKRGKTYSMTMRRIIYYDGASRKLGESLQRIAAANAPLKAK
jgi:hypothetical protein